MTRIEKINRKNLKRFCWRSGLSVASLCRELGISRNTAYEAVADPSTRPLAYKKIHARLFKNEHATN